MRKTHFTTMLSLGAALAASLTAALSGCEPDEDRCDPSLCHPPEVVGPPPACACENPFGEDPEETETWGVTATVDLDLPSGWTLNSVQLSPKSVGISTITPGVGPVGVRVAGADFQSTGLGAWSLTGGLIAPSDTVTGSDPVAVIRWDAPIVIDATRPNGLPYHQTFNAPKSAIDLSSTTVTGGVALSGSTTIGPVTVSISAAVLEN